MQVRLSERRKQSNFGNKIGSSVSKRRTKRALPGLGLSLGYTLFYLSVIVLIPLLTLFSSSFSLSWTQFWEIVTQPRALASYRLTFGASLLAATINLFFGLIIAWVLVRYKFPFKRFIDALVDLPFALPTSVAGIALTALLASNGWVGQWLEQPAQAFTQLLNWSVQYAAWLVGISVSSVLLIFYLMRFGYKEGQNPILSRLYFLVSFIAFLSISIFLVSLLLLLYGWWAQTSSFTGIQVAFTPKGVVIALIFIGLPFVVRTVQPILQDFEKEQEEAAESLGATRWQTFYFVILPALMPALLTGFALSFARAVGEYGSVIFIAGNMPMVSEITPLIIVGKLEQYDYAGATAIAIVMLVISFSLLLIINGLQVWQRRALER